MKGKYEKKPPKGQMARRLVYFCIAVLSLTLVWAAGLKTVSLFLPEPMTVDVSDVLTFVGAAFGGELLLLLLKRVFAKETNSSEQEEGYE